MDFLKEDEALQGHMPPIKMKKDAQPRRALKPMKSNIDEDIDFLREVDRFVNR